MWPVLLKYLAKISAVSLSAQVPGRSYHPLPCIQYINLVFPKSRVLYPFDVILLRSVAYMIEYTFHEQP